jgi:hypothetical protein
MSAITADPQQGSAAGERGRLRGRWVWPAGYLAAAVGDPAGQFIVMTYAYNLLTRHG